MRFRLLSLVGMFALGMGCPASEPTDGGVAGDGGTAVDAGDVDAGDVDAGDVDAGDGGAGPGGDGGAAGACPVEGYAACGGDLSGEWRFVALCPDAMDEAPCESPFSQEPACVGEGNDVTCSLDVSGGLTFGDGMVHVDRTLAVVARYTFSEACLAVVRADDGDTGEARCAALSNPPALGCSWTSGACVCEGRTGEDVIDESVPFSTDGTALSLADFDASYCASGDALTLDFDPHPLSWRYWVLERP